MKHLLLVLLMLIVMSSKAQTSEWTFHPLNMDLCGYWLNPNGCGGCSSCAEPFNSDAAIMDGIQVDYTQASISVCPYSLDTTHIDNILVTSGWGSTPNSSYFQTPVFHSTQLQIDTIEVVIGKQAFGCDSSSVSLSMNSSENVIAEHHNTSILDTVVIANAGVSTTGYFGVFIRGWGGNGQLLIKNVRIVCSIPSMNSIYETEKDNLFTVADGGILLNETKEIAVYDASGRVLYQNKISGFLPLNLGMNIVRIGSITKKIIL